MTERHYYVAVFVSEMHPSTPSHAPLFEESFVFLVASSFEEAMSKAQARTSNLTYKNEYGETISWDGKLVEVGGALASALKDGVEVYARFFRNRQAYENLEFESFERPEVST